MNSAHLETSETKNVRLMPVEPHVKSSKTRKLFNAGVSVKAETAKSADPTCYNVSRSKKGPGCLKNKSERDMERAIALKKLVALLGKKLGYRIDNKAATKEEREAAQAELPAACAERDALKEKQRARLEAVLAADVEYQTLKSSYAAARERAERLFSVTRHRKITVGTSEGMFFFVKAEGDSWEEVIDKLTEKKVAT